MVKYMSRHCKSKNTALCLFAIACFSFDFFYVNIDQDFVNFAFFDVFSTR